MSLLSRIFYYSFFLTKEKKIWFVFALGQLFSAVLIGVGAKGIFFSMRFSWSVALLGLCFLSLFTTFFWLQIKQAYLNLQLVKQVELSAKQKPLLYLRMYGVFIIFALSLLAVKVVFWHWVWVIFFISIMTSFFLPMLLFLCLYNRNIVESLQFSKNFWSSKTSIPVFFSLGFMLGNTISYWSAKTQIQGSFQAGFSDFSSSAKIWLLVVLGLGLSVYMLAIFNTFLVIGFLEIIKPISFVAEEDAETVLAADYAK